MVLLEIFSIEKVYFENYEFTKDSDIVQDSKSISKKIFSFPKFYHFLEKKNFSSKVIISNLIQYFPKINMHFIIDFIKKNKPKIILIRNHSSVDIKILREIKLIGNHNPYVILYVGFPIPLEYYKYVDLVLFRNNFLYKKFSCYAKSADIYYHSFDETLIEIFHEENKKIYPISFLGSSVGGIALDHNYRYQILFELLSEDVIKNVFVYEVLDKTKLIRFYNIFIKKKFGSNGLKIFKKIIYLIMLFNKNFFKKYFKFFELILIDIEKLEGDNLNYYGPLKKIFKNVKEGKFGLDYYNIIKKSKISLNIHSNFSKEDFGFNIRNFEIMGMGSCLLVNDGKGIDQLFIKDEDLMVFKNYDDLKSKILTLINDNKKIEYLSINGKNKIHLNHTHNLRNNYLYEKLKLLKLITHEI
jgi:hypothetical protein